MSVKCKEKQVSNRAATEDRSVQPPGVILHGLRCDCRDPPLPDIFGVMQATLSVTVS